MPPRLRRLSGKDVVRTLGLFGFEIAKQPGSHVKLRRQIGEAVQVLTIPVHRELDTGTLRAIFRQACRYVAEQDLRRHFFSDD
jgi:predicted RNA binding protein YcfA (HicA-like mRNA interferase family)